MLVAPVTASRQTRLTVLPVIPVPARLKNARSPAASILPFASVPDWMVTGFPLWKMYDPLHCQPEAAPRAKRFSQCGAGMSYNQVIANLWVTSSAERAHSLARLYESCARRGFTALVFRSFVELSIAFA